jgi:soluble lytic murein transglycosylase-like protein
MFSDLHRLLLRTCCLWGLLLLPKALLAQETDVRHDGAAGRTTPVVLGHSEMAIALRQHAVALQGGLCADADAPHLNLIFPDSAEQEPTRSRLLSTQALLQGESLRCTGQVSLAVPAWRQAAALDPVWTPVVNRRLQAAGAEPLPWPMEQGGAGSHRLWRRAIADSHTRETATSFLLDRYHSGTCTAWLRRQIAVVLEAVPAAQRNEALQAWLLTRVEEADDLTEFRRRLAFVPQIPTDRVTRWTALAMDLALQQGWNRNRELLQSTLDVIDRESHALELMGDALAGGDAERIAALQSLRRELRDVRLVAWHPERSRLRERQARRVISVLLMREQRRGNHDRDALELALQELPVSADFRAEYSSACVQLAGLANRHVVQLQCLNVALTSELPSVEQAHLVVEAIVDALAVGDHSAAAQTLENGLVLALTPELPLWEAQRLTYWQARVRLEQGQLVAAAQLLRHVRRMAPLGYYGVMADGWLEHIFSQGQTDALIGTLQTTPSGSPDDSRASTALALLDAGLTSLAREELVWQAQFFGADAPVVAALAGVVQAERGELANAVWTLTRLADVEHWSQPQLASLPRTVIFHAWPTAFEKAVNEASAATGVDSAWLYAFIRRESAFEPNARSSAGAQGLMQLLPTTARRLARTVWPAGQPAPLQDPSVNVMLGATFLRQRLAMAGGCIEPAVAAYSAGPAHARNWLQHTPDAWNDVWLERVSYPTVRDYVRDVVPAAAMYRAVLGQPWQSPLCRVNADELAEHHAQPAAASL